MSAPSLRYEDKEHVVEWSYGTLRRSLILPENCDVEGPAASFKDGVLSLTFPKEESSFARKMIYL